MYVKSILVIASYTLVPDTVSHRADHPAGVVSVGEVDLERGDLLLQVHGDVLPVIPSDQLLVGQVPLDGVLVEGVAIRGTGERGDLVLLHGLGFRQGQNPKRHGVSTGRRIRSCAYTRFRAGVVLT